MSDISATINPYKEIPAGLTTTNTVSSATLNVNSTSSNGSYWIGDGTYRPDQIYTMTSPTTQTDYTYITAPYPSTTDINEINKWAARRSAVTPDGERAEMHPDSKSGHLTSELFNDL